MAALFRADSAEPTKADSLLRVADPYAIGTAIFDAWNFPDSAETVIRLARAFVAAPKHRIPSWFDDPWVRRQILAGALAFRGHLREAQTLFGNRQPGWFSSFPAEIALVGGGPHQDADRVFGRWLREGPLWAGDWPADGPPGPLFFALPWWASRRDTQALARYGHRADSAQRSTSRPMHKEVAQYAAQAALAYSALARGDTVRALRHFHTLPHDVFWGGLDRVTEGEILARQGRDAEALALFEGAFTDDWKGPVRVLSSLEAARVAERLGDRERASAGYQYVLDAWRYADPELQTYVAEARQGLARLTSEPRP